jgi:hypothetical protein
MFLTFWFSVTWFLLKGADSMRPSALQRMYALIWLYVGSWVLLVGATVSENNFHLAGGYFLVFYFAAVFLSLVICYLELLALPTKEDYANIIIDHASLSQHLPRGRSPSSRPSTSTDEAADGERSEQVDDDSNERTSLLRGDGRATFRRGYGVQRGATRESDFDDTELFKALPRPYGKEQAWSGKLPSWTWLIQFLLLGPIPIILVGQVGLLMTSALHQTPADGSPVLTVYFFLAALTVLLLAPAVPFIHRFNYTIPLLLFLVFGATLIFNLMAFPFTDHSRLKVYFVQRVNLDTGVNQVNLAGLSPFVQDIISSIPSSAGQKPNCSSPEYAARNGLAQCSWTGPPPNVLDLPGEIPPETSYSTWLDYTAHRKSNTSSTATISIASNNTRACRIFFDTPLMSYSVKGFATDPDRFPIIGKKGCTSIRLWSREWSGSWEVDVEWNKTASAGLDGRVVCLWSDANDPKTIPAYEEVKRFMPRWSLVTKMSDGLVEGYKEFKI